MLKISALPVVTWPIAFAFQDEEGETPSLEVVYRILPMVDGNDALETEAQQRAFFGRAIVEIHGLIDDDGRAIIDHLPVLDALLDRFEIRTALLRGYFEARAEAARGN